MRKQMLCLVVFLLTLISAPSLAAGDEAQITEALRQAGVAQPVQLSRWGGTAVCLGESEGAKRLMLLEKRDDAWQIVINNPTALIQNADWPKLWLDSDNAVFWTYTLSDTETVRYHSPRNADGTWGPVDQFFGDNGYGAYTHIWITYWDDSHGGEIIRSFSEADGNDNMIGGEINQYLPASWLAGSIRLADFDVSRFPTMFIGANDHFASENERFFREAATVQMPEYAYVKGMLKNGAMHFLMEKPDGCRVYAVCEYASHRAINIIESSPLPAGTALGWENFTDSLRIDGRCVTIQLLYSGKAGLESIYDDSASSSGGFLFFGDRTVWDASEAPARTILYGDHPWGDITQMDWTSLPHSLDEASVRMDASSYAMVVNPNPADRLHLRERADKGSRSQGKYYTGTPVGVSAQDGDWTLVIFGDWHSWRHGYMMKRYLAFGQAGSALRLDLSPMPQLSAKDEQLKVYKKPKTGDCIWHTNADTYAMRVIGVIGDD